MVKFYKDLDGNWHLGDKIIPAGTCWIDYDETDDIRIVSLYDSKDIKFEGAFTSLVKEDGTNGTVIGQGNVTLFDGIAITTSTTRALMMTSPITINTTIPLLIDVTYTWSTKSTSNSIRTTNVTIESFN